MWETGEAKRTRFPQGSVLPSSALTVSVVSTSVVNGCPFTATQIVTSEFRHSEQRHLVTFLTDNKIVALL